jgi:hypothetical protein
VEQQYAREDVMAALREGTRRLGDSNEAVNRLQKNVFR